MNKILLLFAFVIAGCSTLDRAARDPAATVKSDQRPAHTATGCSLTGSGDVYGYDKATRKFQKDLADSYALSAARTSIGNSTYFYKETKHFSDGRPDQITGFKQSNDIGPFDFSAPDGSLKSAGVCTRTGHCAGILSIPAANFTGHFVTDFDAGGIRTLTFTDDGSFVDEVLSPSPECNF